MLLSLPYAVSDGELDALEVKPMSSILAAGALALSRDFIGGEIESL